MAVKFEDYYQVLGVDRKATQAEIQRAFRKLARQYHPDVNKEPGAEERFRKINEAYEVLKDPEKRRKYDRLGENWKAGQEFRPPPGWEEVRFEFGGPGRGGGFRPGNFSDFFEMFFGSRAGAFDDLFEQMARGGAGRRADGFTQEPPREAPPQEVPLTISLHEAYHGTTRRLDLQSPDGRSRSLEVKIPPGVTEGSKIRLRGQGVILRIHVAPDPRFEVSGHDLTTDLRLTPWEAALGAQVDVPALQGALTVRIPPGASSGQKLRLRGKGLPRTGDGPPGDLFVRLLISVPKTLSDEERQLYEKLKEVSKFNPRE